MGQETALTIRQVTGGFILESYSNLLGNTTEVFTSQGKLLKAVRLAIEAGSGKSDDAAEAAE